MIDLHPVLCPKGNKQRNQRVVGVESLGILLENAALQCLIQNSLFPNVSDVAVLGIWFRNVEPHLPRTLAIVAVVIGCMTALRNPKTIRETRVRHGCDHLAEWSLL